MSSRIQYSQPLLNTLLMHLWQELQPHLFLNIMPGAGRTYLWALLPFPLCNSIRLDGKRQCTASFSCLYRCSYRCGFAFRVVVLLKDELSWRVLWSRFSSRISLYIAAFIFPAILISQFLPEKHPHSMMLSPLCLTVGMVFAW